MSMSDIDPIDEECARAAAKSAGLDPDMLFGGSRRAWEIYLSRAKEMRAVYNVLRAHDRRIDAVAGELLAATMGDLTHA